MSKIKKHIATFRSSQDFFLWFLGSLTSGFSAFLLISNIFSFGLNATFQKIADEYRSFFAGITDLVNLRADWLIPDWNPDFISFCIVSSFVYARSSIQLENFEKGKANEVTLSSILFYLLSSIILAFMFLSIPVVSYVFSRMVFLLVFLSPLSLFFILADRQRRQAFGPKHIAYV